MLPLFLILSFFGFKAGTPVAAEAKMPTNLAAKIPAKNLAIVSRDIYPGDDARPCIS
jgi:hypothetical protein